MFSKIISSGTIGFFWCASAKTALASTSGDVPMLALSALAAAETANGAIERMRMVLFRLTDAYYTKNRGSEAARRAARLASLVATA